jgi:6-phosphogluconolactonase
VKQVEVFDSAEEVAAAGAVRVAEAIAGGVRSLVLAGGSTPRRCYELLAEKSLLWGRVAVLFGDERCVPPEDPESNYRMARETLLERVAPGSVHRMPAEPVVGWYMPLDLVLLGIGPDGHTASLFPGRPELQAPGLAVGVRDAPKPPPERVSLTLGALQAARRVIFLVTGADKAEAVARAGRGEVPAGMISNSEWLLDRAASGALVRS